MRKAQRSGLLPDVLWLAHLWFGYTPFSPEHGFAAVIQASLLKYV